MTRPAAQRSDVLRSRTRPPAAAGLRRVRLMEPFIGDSAAHLTLLVAPAGCGKTTLLSHVAEIVPRVAWLALDEQLGSTDVLLAHLAESFDTVPDVIPQWSTTSEFLNAFDGLSEPVLLVLDDVQTLVGTPAAEVVRLLIAHQPTKLRIVLGGRQLPEMGLSRQRLTTVVRETGAEDLRFRTWEVEELFRTCHAVRLSAGEVSKLAQRTAGWAACLTLFHLATSHRSPAVRTALLSSPGGGRLTSRYLAEQVLQQLPPHIHDFVLRTSVLARLSADRCDQLLERTGSAALLDDLGRTGLVDSRSELVGVEAPEYRYHEVLHTHLLDQLETRLGVHESRDLHRRAGERCRDEGVHAEAVRSFSRAQDWDSVRDVIRMAGSDLAADRGSWLEMIPESIRQSDPWVMLALARRLLADGSLHAAVEVYGDAIAAFGGLSGTDTAARELRAVRSWTEPPLGTVDDPHHQLRLAFISPAQVSVPTDHSPIRWCAFGIASLASGKVSDAADAFSTAQREAGVTPTIETLAALGHAVSLTMLGAPTAPEARQRAALIASAIGLPSLERIGDGLIRLLGPYSVGDPVDAVDDLIGACRAAGDDWGEGLLLLFATLRGLATGRTSSATAHRTVELLTRLDAPALATWASVAEAVAAAREGSPWSSLELDRLVRRAASIGPGPRAMALNALSMSVPDGIAAQRAQRTAARLVERSPLARWIRRLESGQHRPAPTNGIPEIGAAPREIRIQVLGAFDVLLDGAPVSTAGLRPQHRELFAVFCAHADQLLHRDQLVEWFWQDTDPGRAQHSLQVAISEIRRLLNPSGQSSAASGLVREGAGYRLRLAEPDNCDARRLEQLVDAAERAHRQGDSIEAVAALTEATELYRGDLIASIGYPEWILAERDRLRQVVIDAYERLVELHAAAGDHAAAVAAARAGLAHDRHRDELWRQLVTSLLALDDRAAAAAARRRYEQLLDELEVGSD